MAIKGAASKQEVTNKILEIFEGAFLYDKEIRVPCYEDGQEVQIKVVLTAAKTNVERGGDTAVPSAPTAAPTNTSSIAIPSADEKEAIKNLVARLF